MQDYPLFLAKNLKTIAIFGNYGVKNLGDDLMLESLILLCDEYNLTPHVFCGSPFNITAGHRVQASVFFPAGFRSIGRLLLVPWSRSALKKSYQALKRSKAVIFGGGGLLVDRHFKAVSLWFMQLLICRLLKKKVYFLGNSIELNHFWSKLLFRPFLKRAKLITVRDTRSQIWLRDAGIKSVVLPDLTFTGYRLQKPPEGPEHVERIKKDPKLISIALCKWSVTTRQLKDLKIFITNLKRKGFKVVYLPFQLENDNDILFIKKLDSRATIINRSDIPSIIQRSHLLLGMRLHSVILAVQNHTPFIALSYQQKVANFVQDLSLSDYLIHISQLNKQNLQHKFTLVLKDHAKLSKQLKKEQKQLSEKAGKYYEIFHHRLK
jgi:polysaccharide pyruvyl transferase CsaB